MEELLGLSRFSVLRSESEPSKKSFCKDTLSLWKYEIIFYMKIMKIKIN